MTDRLWLLSKSCDNRDSPVSWKDISDLVDLVGRLQDEMRKPYRWIEDGDGFSVEDCVGLLGGCLEEISKFRRGE